MGIPAYFRAVTYSGSRMPSWGRIPAAIRSSGVMSAATRPSLMTMIRSTRR